MSALPLDRLERAVLDLTSRLDALQAGAAEQARQAAALERQLAIAEARLAVETMHAAGLAAQASHLMAVVAAANLPGLREEVEGGSAGGVPKRRLAEVYATAFDAKAAELGIEDPVRFREA